MYRRDLRDAAADDLLATMATADAAVEARPEPDGERLAVARVREDRLALWLVGPDGSERRLLGRDAVAMSYTQLDQSWFDWHPAGDAIAYLGPAEAGPALRTVDPETGEIARVVEGTACYDPRFGPDGEEIALVADRPSPGALAVASADGRRFEALADDDYLYADPQWAGPETLYAVRMRHRDLHDRASEVVRVTRDGAVTVVAGGPDGAGHPGDADGAVNAFAPRPSPVSDEVTVVHDGTGYDGVYVVAPGADPEQLLAEDGVDFGTPAWRADGGALAVTATRRGDVEVRTVTRDGAVETLTDEPGERYYPVWDGDDVLAVSGGPTTPPRVVNISREVTVGRRRPVGFGRRLVVPETTAYESPDGTEIHAMVYLPDGHGEKDDDSLPLLVHPHGGPTSFDGYEYNYQAQYFVAQGYAVVEPNYRGSSGFGRAFRNANDHAWGAGDLEDVVAAADAVAEQYPVVDGDRAGIFGGSGGGLMTVNALGKSGRFDAGAAFYGVYDYESFVDDTDDVGWRLMKRELGSLARDVENYRDASPIESVTDIDAPLLVLHGEEDQRVPISQSEQLVEALEQHGKRHEFQRYDGEAHGFARRENILDAYGRVADLFAKYLKVDPGGGGSNPREDLGGGGS